MRKAFAPERTRSIAAVCLSTWGWCRASGKPAALAMAPNSFQTVIRPMRVLFWVLNT